MQGCKKSAAVIGAGFFGCVLAHHLSRTPSISRVFVIESQDLPLRRASINNQARIHRGYHYPRSIKTALASSRSYDKFKKQWPGAVFDVKKHIYGIARNGSSVSSKQFRATMQAVGAPLVEIRDRSILSNFNLRLFDDLFLADEAAFNALELRNWALEILQNPKIDFINNEKVIRVNDFSSKSKITTENGIEFDVDLVFNVTYSGLENIEGIDFGNLDLVEYELTEMPLINAMPSFPYSLTVMDGPFFSMMPYPARGSNLDSVSHVSYTPRRRFKTAFDAEVAFRQVESLVLESNFETIRRHCSLFLPQMASAKQVGSIFELKAILRKSERDDSRPILFHRHVSNRTFSVLGGKIDNVFEMLEYLDREVLN